MKKLIALLFPAFFTCCFPILGKTQTNPTDSFSLVALYNATNGANWTNTWDLSQAVVTWHGVTLDVTGFVIDLDLRNNQLNGNIPPEIGNLSKLVYLFLDNNQLNGNIPPELGNLSNLIILHLPENQLSGSIPPEIGNLSNLEFLRLNNNQLSGSIPSEIGNLTNLGGCWLYINQLSGNVPSEIGNLSNLTTLSLDNNQLSGTIPSEIGNLTNLGYLALGDNQLSGNIPPEIGNLANLTYLFLDNNQLSGSYDANLLNLCNQLTFFFISEGNNFDTTWDAFCAAPSVNLTDSLALVTLYNTTNGTNWVNTWDLNQPISTWYGVTVNADGRVTGLDLSNNQVNGPIPPEIGNLSELTYLACNKCQFSGTIPPEIGNLSNLTGLFLDDNQLIGTIPPEIGNLVNLVGTRLAYNELIGNIPPELGNLSNLEYLWLNNNQLSGSYDSNLIGLCSQLTNYLVSFGNNFDISWDEFCNAINVPCTTTNPTDSLSLVALYNATNGPNWTITWDLNECVSNWHGVTLNATGFVIDLDLKNNQLNGNIPSEIGNLSNLTSLDFYLNQLSGNIPLELFDLGNLKYLYLHENQLSGNIPAEIGNLSNLQNISLRRNQLTGSIPPELGNLSQLFYLSLYGNQLSGAIPSELGNLSYLRDLWLQENYLSGNIPTELGNLSSLRQLRLSNNQLSGNIPTELGNLSNLQFLYLHNNQFSGNIPSELLNLTAIKELRLQDNQLTGSVHDFSTLPDLTYLYIEKNKFTFDSIQSAYDSNTTIFEFEYSPQYHGSPQSFIQELGDALTFTLSETLSGNNNNNVSYQWKKNDNDLTGSTNDTYTVNDLQLDDVGLYTLHMTDPSRVPDLELISEPIYVITPGYDLYGQPVVYNQVMVEFYGEDDRQAYENQYLYPNAGWVQDSCSCNRGLFLWQFPSDTVALQVLLDIDTKVENQDGKADVDGGPNNIFNLGVSNNSGTAWSWAGDYTGETYPDSVSVFMLDSGLDEGNWDATPYLIPDAPKDSCYNIFAPGYDYTDSLTTFSMNYADSLGHGTYGFRSIVEGLDDYMNVKSVPLKVFDQGGEGTLFKFICALYHAIDHDADVINISAGYLGQSSEILTEAMQLAQQKGIFIVTATGNEGQNIDSIPQFPAYFAGATYELEIDTVTYTIPYDNVISVASINAQDSLSAFSNYGINNATLAAYGENMSGYGVGSADVISSGTSISTFYVTRELLAEVAKDKSRSLQQIWADFEANRLTDNPPTHGLTKTGKRLDIQIVNACLPTLTPGGNIADGIYQAGQVVNSNGTIPTGNNVQFKAGDVIILQPGFQIESQSEFSGEIEGCDEN